MIWLWRLGRLGAASWLAWLCWSFVPTERFHAELDAMDDGAASDEDGYSDDETDTGRLPN